MTKILYFLKYNLKNSETDTYKTFILQDEKSNYQLLNHKFKHNHNDIHFSLVVNVEALYRHIYNVKRSDDHHFLIPTMYPVWIDEELPDYKKPLAWSGYDPDFQVFYTKAEFLVFLENISKEVELEKSRTEIELYQCRY